MELLVLLGIKMCQNLPTFLTIQKPYSVDRFSIANFARQSNQIHLMVPTTNVGVSGLYSGCNIPNFSWNVKKSKNVKFQKNLCGML